MQKKKILNGTIKRHPDGFGFFIPEDPEHPDVYVPRNSMEGIMTNDKVAVEVSPEKGGDRFRGDIVKVLHRGTKTVVGRFSKMNEHVGSLRDEGKGWGQDLKIKIEDSMNAKDKELVAAEILSYPDGGKSFTGRVTEVIGNALDPLTDIKRVIRASNIPLEFSKDTLEEAKHIKEVPDEKDFKGRRDLRDKALITIDGATAKDFDDAVYVEMTDQGFRLYVAIADVSHYVRPGTAIDRDAYERGTSVYFPNFVVPMLPEVLSNGLCSLNPHVPRLCLVAEMLFDFTGEMMQSDFYEAIMESKARVTYGEAQEFIDGSSVEKHLHVKEHILRLADLAKILMAKRFKEGSLDLEIPETELVIDGAGVPVDIQRSERLFSHRLIEEMMLAANVGVAKFLSRKKIPAIYRIHEPPNEQAIHVLEKYLESFGGTTKLDQGKLQKRLTKALDEFKGKPEAQILNILTLRSMSQAKYSINNLGHFGLGFDFYTHFTSPIRRYPDLIVHRLIKNQVMPQSSYRLLSEDELASAGTILSAAEQRSVKAERQVQSIKKARFMEKFVGQEFDGMISSVAKFGVFVLLREYDVDGLIRLDDLGGERFEFDEENLRLIAKRSGFSYNIGDMVRIQVAAADPELGQINFVIPSLEKNKVEAKTPYTRSRSQKAEQRAPTKDRHGKKDRPHQAGKKSDGRELSERGRSTKKHGHRKGSSAPSPKEDSRPLFKKEGKTETSYRSDVPGAKKDSAFTRTSKRISKFFSDSRSEKKAPQTPLRPEPRPDQPKGPDKSLLDMILGPERYRNSSPPAEKSNPESTNKSKKLMFAEQSKLRENKELSEKNSDSLKDRSSDRKDTQKRGKTEDHRGGVRKTRVPPGRGKGKTR